MHLAALLSGVYEMNLMEGKFPTNLNLCILNNSLPGLHSACYVLLSICWACVYVHHFLAGKSEHSYASATRFHYA
jgi:hypothetical protein